jgi:hypothetical protein
MNRVLATDLQRVADVPLSAITDEVMHERLQAARRYTLVAPSPGSQLPPSEYHPCRARPARDRPACLTHTGGGHSGRQVDGDRFGAQLPGDGLATRPQPLRRASHEQPGYAYG